MAGHLVPLAALLVQPHPEAAVLHVGVLDPHPERRPDPGEGVDHEPDQGPVAQADHRRDVDSIQELARLLGGQHRRPAALHDMARAAHRGGRVDRHHLAGHQPVEQVADRGQALLDGRRGELARLRLDPGRDVQRPHGGERRHAMALAPGEEVAHGAAVGPARVRVADRGGEELEETQPRSVASGGNKRRDYLATIRGRSDRSWCAAHPLSLCFWELWYRGEGV